MSDFWAVKVSTCRPPPGPGLPAGGQEADGSLHAADQHRRAQVRDGRRVHVGRRPHLAERPQVQPGQRRRR